MPKRKKSDRTSWIVLGIGVVGLFGLIGMTKTRSSSRDAVFSVQSSDSASSAEMATASRSADLEKPSTPALATKETPSLPESNVAELNVPSATIAPKPVEVIPPKPTAVRPVGIVNFIPKTTKLTESVSVPHYEKKQLVGLRPVPIGTTVTIKSVKQDKIVVEIAGGSKEISPTSTDFIEQMIQAAEK